MSEDESKERKHPRVEVDFSFISNGGLESFSWEIDNLSLGGAFIKTRTPLNRDIQFPFKFIVGSGKKSATVQGKAKVVWSKKAESDSGMGIMFLEISDASQQMIENLIRQTANQVK